MGSTDLAGAIYAGKVWFKVPETMLIRVTGQTQPGVTPKDIVLEVIKRIGADGANYMVMEWVGEYIDNLDMEGRFTLTNMAIEAGGKTGIVAVDDTTRAYMAARGVTPDQYTEYQSDADAQFRWSSRWTPRRSSRPWRTRTFPVTGAWRAATGSP